MIARRLVWPLNKQRVRREALASQVRVRVLLGHHCCADRQFALPARVTLGASGTFPLGADGPHDTSAADEFPLLVPVGRGVGLHLGGRDSPLSGWLLVPDAPPWSLTELRADAHVLLRTPVVPLHPGMQARLHYGIWRLEVALVSEPAATTAASAASSRRVATLVQQHRLPGSMTSDTRRRLAGLLAACAVAAGMALVPAPQTPAVVARAAHKRAGLVPSLPENVAEPAQRMAAAAALWQPQPTIAAAQPTAPRPASRHASPEPVVLDVTPAAVLGPRPGAALATSVPIWRPFAPADKDHAPGKK